MKTFLVTAAVIFSISAHADEVKYSFPCGSGVGTELTSAITNAARDLGNNIEKLSSSLKAKYDIQSVAVTSSTFKTINWMSSEGTLCATVAYTEKKAGDKSNSADVHYGFPCGIGYHSWTNVAFNLATQMMTQSTENYVKAIEKDKKFETVKVAGTLITFNESQKVGLVCSTVAFKGVSEEKPSASASLPGTGVN